MVFLSILSGVGGKVFSPSLRLNIHNSYSGMSASWIIATNWDDKPIPRHSKSQRDNNSSFYVSPYVLTKLRGEIIYNYLPSEYSFHTIYIYDGNPGDSRRIKFSYIGLCLFKNASKNSTTWKSVYLLLWTWISHQA